MTIIKVKKYLRLKEVGIVNYRKFTIILNILLNQHVLYLIKGLLLPPSSTSYLQKWLSGLSTLFVFVHFIYEWEINIRKQEKILFLEVCHKRQLKIITLWAKSVLTTFQVEPLTAMRVGMSTTQKLAPFNVRREPLLSCTHFCKKV